ncbi:HIT domain-containing protein [Acidimicrobiaceae bacterium USS-CC1]|uniref:HIT domain-containing protein n=1 Tax=Acidiferrimicrobium australe TaxID=2664430 RepID=A0ABW9QVF0_9ACTN|nr:HIT domain-containing protein [Acidiferrimicrobium australe]
MSLSSFEGLPHSQWVAENDLAFAVRDAFPVSPGHTLVVTKRRTPTWWEATAAERAAVMDLVSVVAAALDEELHPDGYNVGFNAGEAAGQTVPHLHVHVIPRWTGDVADPRGGIRHALPGGNYLHGPALVDNAARSAASVIEECLRDRRFDRADLVVSFVMLSGVRLIEKPLQDALDRGLGARLLTTDYLGTTEPEALSRLIDLAETSDGRLQVRVFSDPRTSFHPKGYLFWSSTTGAALQLIGSSNLSRSGIRDGVEWNLLTGSLKPLVSEYEQLWADRRSLPLTHGWLRRYRSRPRGRRVAPAEVDAEVYEPPPVATPRPVQEEALAALRETRAAGHRRGLVVLATGLGKTWLAAFSAREATAKRVLFVAHREEILRQSRDVFRAVLPGCDAGLFTGDERALDSDVLFASVQSLGRNLHRWAADHFDLVVVDEFHHAAAPTYRRIIEHFTPSFLLGITATPDRLDGADLLALCDDNLVFECGLLEGIARGDLCTFGYWAERDVADFAPIPWRNGRFDPEHLRSAVETGERARQEYEAWTARRGSRTLAFCCSVTHADFMTEYFLEQNPSVRAVAVHSGPTSAPRQLALQQLAAGDLDIIFSVDLLNEGVDVPDVDTVLMLRPTDSPVVFLQQLGRGLRRPRPDKHLTVVDFIGNHRSFLAKPRTLLSLADRDAVTTTAVLDAMATGDFGLPDGCSVSYDLEAVDLMRQLTAREQGSALIRYCRAYAAEHGHRPTAVQVYRASYNPGSQGSVGWLGVLGETGLLDGAEQEATRVAGGLLRAVEKESFTKSYKLVTLEQFLDLGGLASGVDVAALAERCRLRMRSSPTLAVDAGDHLDDPPPEWERYWRRWPIAAWTGSLPASRAGLFRLRDDRFELRDEVPPAVRATVAALLAEWVDYRLCRYVDTKRLAEGAWQLRVSHNASGNPIIWLDRRKHPGLPEGEAAVRIDGEDCVGVFRAVALNVVRKSGSPTNVLPAVLRRWFGDDAGQPGTHHTVELLRDEGMLILRPRSQVRDRPSS